MDRSGPILLLLGLVLSLAVGELVVRAYVYADEDFAHSFATFDPLGARVRAMTPGDTLGYRQKPNQVFRYGNGTKATSNAQGFRGPTVEVPKPRGVTRIVLLGGSTTHGWGVSDHETIDAYMREILERRAPGREYDVVNLAFDGYDSFQLLKRFRVDGLPLEPDVVVVSSGINDVRNARYDGLRLGDPRTVLWRDVLGRQRRILEQGDPSTWSLVKHHVYLARLIAYSTQGLRRDESREIEPHAHQSHPEAADVYRKAIALLSEEILNAGAVLLLSNPPSALKSNYARDATSPVSYWLQDAAATEAYRSRLREITRVLADSLSSEGHPVAYVTHSVPASRFIDDCHLTPYGNRTVARDFVEAVLTFEPGESGGDT